VPPACCPLQRLDGRTETTVHGASPGPGGMVAPGTRASVLGWELLAPTDLARHNVRRLMASPAAPFSEVAGHQTPIRGLWHIGALAHPGPWLSGGSGHLVAQN
jgi:phytoene dehydrogenase-like protein